MSQVSRIAFLSILVAGTLACGLFSSPISGVQNLASTAEALATAIPSGIPNLPDVTGYLNPTGAPAKEWNGIPIMPQATAGQEFNANTYSYKIGTVSQADVQAFYSDKLKGLGWSSQFTAGTGAEGAVMLFSKDSSVLTITVVKADQDNVVLLFTQ
jgi:hypothetical protein